MSVALPVRLAPVGEYWKLDKDWRLAEMINRNRASPVWVVDTLLCGK